MQLRQRPLELADVVDFRREPHVRRPRPECFWPVDALELAERLVGQNCSEDSDAEEM